MNIINKYGLFTVLTGLVFTFSQCKKEKVEFNIIPPSAGQSMTLSGIVSTETGINAKNSVYVDMSKNLQTPVLRSLWDLGFYCGSDFKVIINHSTGATAIQLDKTDLTAVTAADSTALPAGANTLGTAALSTVDPVDGNYASFLSGLVIDDVSANAAENKVYILNRGMAGDIASRSWIKIKITRITNGYTVTYGRIGALSFNTYDILKDGSFNFKYISFTNASISVEPAKALWDFEWTLTTYKDVATGLPVSTPDFVVINYGAGVTAAEVVFGADESKNYANFGEDDLTGITFSGARDVIGTKWRNSATSNATTLNINNDRFYLVKDPAGNIYKLRFSGGLRGKPELVYALVKAAA